MTPSGLAAGPAASAGEPYDPDGGLLIRVWVEPDSAEPVRARVLTFHGNAEPSTWATAAGEAAVLDAVDRWMRERVRAAVAP
jgi:hypothetical protein